MSSPVCPDCGDTGIGLLGIHEWVDWVQVMVNGNQFISFKKSMEHLARPVEESRKWKH